ncbi:MAG: 3-methyl-2-oxobutanoate hydroxymethyltransferase [Candidatus Puniceispirillum sp.]
MTINRFTALKAERKIVCLTAYSAPMAAILDPHCDLLLVGDSLAMVLYGMDNTQGADIDMMIRHAQAVMRGAKQALVVVDLPAGSYEASPEKALATAKQIMQESGADAVKLEGGAVLQPHIKLLVENGIPVMGHIGLLPQKASSASMYRITGKTADEAGLLHADMTALVEAGVFSIVMEGIIEPVAKEIATACSVPTIGIGASTACDGQILVTDDMVGLFDKFVPTFVRQFGQLNPAITEAVDAYRAAVIDGSFPAKEHMFWPKPEK